MPEVCVASGCSGFKCLAFSPDKKEAKKAKVRLRNSSLFFAFLHPSPALLLNHLEHRFWLLSSDSTESLRSSHQVTAVEIP